MNEKKTIAVHVMNHGKVQVEKGITLNELLQDIWKEKSRDYLCARIRNEIKHLGFRLEEDTDIEFLDMTSKDGMRIYKRTLSFIFIKACKDLFEGARVSIEHSLSKGLYVEVHMDRGLVLDDVKKIKSRIQELIDEDLPIERPLIPTKEADEIFSRQNMKDKLRLSKYRPKNVIHLSHIDGLYDKFYGYLAPSTGCIKSFDLKYYRPGIIIQYPRKESNFTIPKFEHQNKLSKIFKEAEEWGDILDIGYVGALNDIVMNGSIEDMIRVSEALHEKKIALIADQISEDPNKRIILIAGPSSSGKTTFAQRLAIHLRVNGKKPMSLSLDDYFVNREDTPKDDEGKFDFESLYAIDIDKFNEDLIQLMNGKGITLPKFNFVTGKREYRKHVTRIDKDQPIIIEGIHGLNEKLTESIPQGNKFKIYVSALTQLNIDAHNRIPTTDTRLIRRMVRDYNYRGNDASRTLELWSSVRRGEEQNIFPFQEEADVMFNSALVYELAVLKKYAIPLLKQIEPNNVYYSESKRLLKFLGYFKDLDNEGVIPNTSIVREFIGGSCFREE